MGVGMAVVGHRGCPGRRGRGVDRDLSMNWMVLDQRDTIIRPGGWPGGGRRKSFLQRCLEGLNPLREGGKTFDFLSREKNIRRHAAQKAASKGQRGRAGS